MCHQSNWQPPPDVNMVELIGWGLIGFDVLNSIVSPTPDTGILGASMVAGTRIGATGFVRGTGFSSFSALKRHLGPAGPGKAWHHIVEQTPANIKKFGAQLVQNTGNVISIPHGKGLLHQRISGYYSSKRGFTNGKTVREWLKTKSFDEQYEFGQKILKQFGGAP